MTNDIKLSWFEKHGHKSKKTEALRKKYKNRIKKYERFLDESKRLNIPIHPETLELIRFKIGIWEVQESRLITVWRFKNGYTKWWNEPYCYSQEIYKEHGVIPKVPFKNPDVQKMSNWYLENFPEYVRPLNLDDLWNGKAKKPVFEHTSLNKLIWKFIFRK